MRKSLNQNGVTQLAKDFAENIESYQLDIVMNKSEMITLRISKPFKKDIKIAAHAYGLSVTEYLTQLHRIFTLCKSPKWHEIMKGSLY